MPRKLTAFNEAQKMVAEANRSMGLTRASSSCALQKRTSNTKESTRSQRFRLSDEDSSDDDDEDDSQGARLVSQWFAPKGKGKETAVVEVEDAVEETGTQIRVKAERRNSQSASTQRRGGGASMIPKESTVIDLTLQSTDDEMPKSTTQKAKAKSTSTSKASGSQRSTTDGKTVVKKGQKTPPGKSEAEKARLKRMMSGGSGKSEGDSIVLLDTDEEGDIASKPVLSVSSLEFHCVACVLSRFIRNPSSSQAHHSVNHYPENPYRRAVPPKLRNHHLRHHIVKPWLNGGTRHQLHHRHASSRNPIPHHLSSRILRVHHRQRSRLHCCSLHPQRAHRVKAAVRSGPVKRPTNAIQSEWKCWHLLPGQFRAMSI